MSRFEHVEGAWRIESGKQRRQRRGPALSNVLAMT
jgi:hypothetical protein